MLRSGCLAARRMSPSTMPTQTSMTDMLLASERTLFISPAPIAFPIITPEAEDMATTITLRY